MRPSDDPFAREVSTFRAPEDLARLLASIPEPDAPAPFRGPRGKLRKEGWQAVALSLGYQAMMGTSVEVRVIPDESFADFQLRLPGATFDFQSTMAVNGRNGNGNGNGNGHGHVAASVPTDDATRRACGGYDAALVAAAQRKADGRDTRGVHLLISAYDAHADADPALVARVVRETLGDAYESAWVVLGERLLCAKRSPELPAIAGWIRLPIHPPAMD